MSNARLPGPRHNTIPIETKVGFAVLFGFVALVSICSWLWYNSQGGGGIPLHIQNAPVANHISPEQYLSPLERSESSIAARLQRLEAQLPHNGTDSPTQTVASTVAAQPTARETTPQPIERSPKQRIVLSTQSPRQPAATPSRDIAKSFSATGSFNNQKIPAELRPPTNSFAAKRPTGEFERPANRNPSSNLADQPATTDDVKLTSFEQEVALRAKPKNDFTAADQDTDFKPLKRLKPVDPFIPTNTPQQKSTTENALRTPNSFSGEPVQPDEIDDSDSDLEIEVIDSVSATKTATADQTETKAQPKTDAPSNIQYSIVKGDSFWSIAQQKYDDGRFFKALYEHNRTRVDSFENLPAGTVIETPALAELKQLYSHLCPISADNPAPASDDSNYCTKQGDTLFNIAREFTGQASNYLEIIRLNRQVLPKDVDHLTRLPIGLKLQMPTR